GVGRAGPSPRAVRVEHPQHLADLDVLALLPLDAGEHAGTLGADLEIDLVGLELDQRLAGGDGVSFLFQPARDARLDDGLTKLRDDDIHWVKIVAGSRQQAELQFGREPPAVAGPNFRPDGRRTLALHLPRHHHVGAAAALD